MGKKLAKTFYDATDIALIGYSQKNEGYCRMISDSLVEAGKKVYPINPRGGWNETTVYESISKTGIKPQMAIVMTGKENTAKVIDELIKEKVQKVVFCSSLSADQQMVDTCTKAGMEAKVACPLMTFGKGFHRFHGWLAGVEKWT